MNNSISTHSISIGPLESPPPSFSSDASENSENEMFQSKWKRTPEKCLLLDEDVEFGQIQSLKNTEPFVMKFYYLNSSHFSEDHFKNHVFCQFDDFAEVNIAEAEKCLSCINDDRVLLETVQIEINACDPRSKPLIEGALLEFAERRKKCNEVVMVKRLIFHIFDFTYARDLAPIIAKIAPRAYEINIGMPMKKVYPLQPSLESGYVIDFLKVLLNPSNCSETIRVLRIYNFISIDTIFQDLLAECPRLIHLTLSNIDEVSVFEAENVQSVLFDSCDMATTYLDVDFAEKSARLFPKATIFGYMRCEMSLAIVAIEQFKSNRIGDSRSEIQFHQPDQDFREFLYAATKNFEILNDDNELEGEIQIQGHNGGPVITVFNKDRGYKARIDNC